MKIKQGEIIKLKITVVVEVSSEEYEDTETIIDELNAESFYTIDGTDNITVHQTEWRDTELI